MNNPLKSLKKSIANAFKTKEEKHKEFLEKEYDLGHILKIEGNKNGF